MQAVRGGVLQQEGVGVAQHVAQARRPLHQQGGGQEVGCGKDRPGVFSVFMAVALQPTN